MQVRPFASQDWDAFAGAERGPLGQTPAIGFTHDEVGVVVVDRDGVQVFFLVDGDPEEVWTWTGTFAAGLAIAAALVDPILKEQLEALGFRKVGS